MKEGCSGYQGLEESSLSQPGSRMGDKEEIKDMPRLSLQGEIRANW